MKSLFVPIIVLVLAMPPPASADTPSPTESLQGPIDRVIEILNDSRYEPADQKAAQQKALWEEVTTVFDFDLIARLSLGQYRRDFSPEQMEAFTRHFSELLADTYIAKVQDNYSGERVMYHGEDLLSDSKAVVHTVIARQPAELPIAYSMRLRGGTWRIYDVNVEGVSLVKNYRTQFKKILFKEKPQDLIDRLAEKLREQETGAGDKPQE